MRKVDDEKLKRMKEDEVQAEIVIEGLTHGEKMELLTLIMNDPEIKLEVVIPDSESTTNNEEES